MIDFNRSALFILTYTILLLSFNSFAQRYCGTKHNSESDFIDNISQYSRSKVEIPDSIITIPVVFHVIYNRPTENVEFAELESQIKVLNEDFRRKNADTTNIWPQAADTGIEFCMAKIDIDGNYFNGITRTYTSETSFFYEEDKIFLAEYGKEVWPGYLNIYVCNLGVDEHGVAGFSSLPGYDAYRDAVVLDYQFTGIFGTFYSFNYAGGRTATHEVGHWLNLIHPWGAEADTACILDDFVDDTPESNLPYMQCNTGSSCGSVDMAENFMDYHYDHCMNLFTKGQARRIRLSIYKLQSRTFLLNHTKCGTAFDSINIDIPLNNVLEDIKACNQVTASSDIISNANVSYVSETSVSLLNGFSVDTSSNLSVYIEPCP